MASYDPSKQTVIDMANARKATSINVDAIRILIWNGKQEWEQHKSLVQILSNDPVFDKFPKQHVLRPERFKRGLAITHRLAELQDKHEWSERQAAMASGLTDEVTSVGTHNIAFTPPILSQGSRELVEKYGSLAVHKAILGCYAQTELGHGTNVASVETTATFIPGTDDSTASFEIHSPTLSSTKWWIGGAGKFSTHAVVQARLLLPTGEDKGPHLFLVQLRSLEDHTLLKGIATGDIGSKAFGAFAANDNGFIRFDRVRIPRSAMLSKFAGVTPDGTYVVPPHSKLSYGGMLFIRSGMITAAGWQLAKAITIAIRYATVRRQGGSPGNEKQVINHPSVQYRLLPVLSRAYVYILLGREIIKGFEKMTSMLASGDTSLLAETHAILSALKVLVSTSSVESIEIARRSMGGHGFSSAAGVGRLYGDHLPSTTYEGDNFVLDQQVVRAAIKAHTSFTAPGQKYETSPSTAYLRHLKISPHSLPSFSWRDRDQVIGLLERRAALVVQARASQHLLEDAGADQRTSQAVGEAFVASQVGAMVNGLKGTCGDRERSVLEDLLLLYLLTTVEGALTDLFSFSLLKGQEPVALLRAEIAGLCGSLLPHSIGLTDAFGFTDWELDSALGVYDGSVYQELWNRAQLEPLNEKDVVDGYEQYLKPLMERGRARVSGSKSKL